MTSQLAWLLGIPGAAFLLSLAWPSIRRAYGHALRCLARHPVVWTLPTGFALAYGIFDFLTLSVVRWRGGRGWPEFFEWHGQWPVLELGWSSGVPVVEQLAGSWNCLVSVFPLSVWAALLFIVNYRSLTRELIRTLTKRFGWVGWLLVMGLVLCALAEIVKPGLIMLLPELAARFPWTLLLLGATVLNALAFAFEYLFGTALQLYLLLTIYGWVRGLQLDERRMLPFAVRRLGFVIKWSLVIITASILLIHLPLGLDAWWTGSIRWPAEALRLSLALAMLVCGAVQIQLALHNDSLRQAFAANRRFLREHGLAYLSLVIGALGLFFMLQVVRMTGEAMLGETIVSSGWSILVHVAGAAVGGWVLAAWVCFYQERVGGRTIEY